MTYPDAKNYINGKWVEGGAESGESVNPADGAVLGRYYPGSKALVDEAAAVARKTFMTTGWAASPRLRAQVLYEFADRLEAAKDELVELIVAENGKLKGEATGEMMGSISETRYYAGLARTVLGRTLESAPGNFSMMNREAAGVAGVIVPWNAPVTLNIRSLTPALAAGCTAVVKPAAQTPLIHARVMRCLDECPSLPAGVVNSVNEIGTEVGEAMVASPDIDVISFTGSSATGKRIMAGAAPTLKRLSLELGGKAPVIVLDDADIDAAVDAAVFGAFFNQGQICMSTERIVIDEGIADTFVEKFRLRADAIRAGDPRDPGCVLGAMITEQAAQRVKSLIDDAAMKGATLVTGGRQEGVFVDPAILDNVSPAMRIYHEESFGPVASIIRVSGDDEAVSVANDTEYGLSAAVFSRDVGRALAIAQRLETGICHINSATIHDEPQMPFGGVKASGYGRFGGKAGIDEFTELRWITIQQGENRYPI